MLNKRLLNLKQTDLLIFLQNKFFFKSLSENLEEKTSKFVIVSTYSIKTMKEIHQKFLFILKFLSVKNKKKWSQKSPISLSSSRSLFEHTTHHNPNVTMFNQEG